MLFHRDDRPEQNALADVHELMGVGFAYLLVLGGCVVSFWVAVDGFQDLVAGKASWETGLFFLIALAGAPWLAERAARFPKEGFQFLEAGAGRRDHPDEPWRWRDEWVRNRLADHAANECLRAGAVTAALLLLGFLLWLQLPPVPQNSHWVTWIFSAICIAGSLALLFTTYLCLRWKKFGTTVLILDPMPAPFGGIVNGSIRVHLSRSAGGPQRFRIKLKNLRFRYRARTLTLTDAAREISLLIPDQGEVVVPISIPVPPGGRPTEISQGAWDIEWRLRVSASLPGIDYSARFDVPVYPTRPMQPTAERQGTG